MSTQSKSLRLSTTFKPRAAKVNKYSVNNKSSQGGVKQKPSTVVTPQLQLLPHSKVNDGQTQNQSRSQRQGQGPNQSDDQSSDSDSSEDDRHPPAHLSIIESKRTAAKMYADARDLREAKLAGTVQRNHVSVIDGRGNGECVGDSVNTPPPSPLKTKTTTNPIRGVLKRSSFGSKTSAIDNNETLAMTATRSRTSPSSPVHFLDELLRKSNVGVSSEILSLEFTDISAVGLGDEGVADFSVYRELVNGANDSSVLTSNAVVLDVPVPVTAIAPAIVDGTEKNDVGDEKEKDNENNSVLDIQLRNMPTSVLSESGSVIGQGRVIPHAQKIAPKDNETDVPTTPTIPNTKLNLDPTSLLLNVPPHNQQQTNNNSAPYSNTDISSFDIFSPHNISQGLCLQNFGYAPGEIVSKLRSESCISEDEDRMIRYLLSRDDADVLRMLVFIEEEGITKESVGVFREMVRRRRQLFRSSPQRMNGNGNGNGGDGSAGSVFFRNGNGNGNGAEGESDGHEDDVDRPPTRPNTALPSVVPDGPDTVHDGSDVQPQTTTSNEHQQQQQHNQQQQQQQHKQPLQNTIHKVLIKIAHRLRTLKSLPQSSTPSAEKEKVIIIGSGLYNPLHRLHLRMFYLARQFLESNSDFEVLGGIVSPSHPTALLTKFRQTSSEVIPPKHRLAMARLSVGDSAWLTVDPWEITRRRVLDYLSVIDHVRLIVSTSFPKERIRLIYLCDGNMLPTLNTAELLERNCYCLSICRPQKVDILLKQLTKEWKICAYILEDTAILSSDLERITSNQIRKDSISGKDVSKSLTVKVAKYMLKHRINVKMGGGERWNMEDKKFDFDVDGEDEMDRPYVMMPMPMVEGGEREEKGVGRGVKHKEEFSLLF